MIENIPILQAQDVSARGVTDDLRKGTFIGVAESSGLSARAKKRLLKKRKRPLADDFFRDLIDGDDDDGPGEGDGGDGGEDADSDDNSDNDINIDEDEDEAK